MKILISLFTLFTIHAYAQSEGTDLTDDQEKSCCSDINIKLKQNLQIIEVNDQTFYGLFTAHLGSQPRNYISQIMPFLFDPNYEEEAIRRLRNVLISYSDTVKSEKNDVSTIVKLLKSDDAHLQWIGIELSEEELRKTPIQPRVVQYKTLKTFLSLRGIDDLLYLIFANHTIALAEHPELFEGIELVPLDDDFHKKKPTEKVIITTLEEMAQIMPHKASELEHIVATALTNTIKILEKQMSAELSKIEDAEMRAFAASLFEHTNQFIEEIWERDKIMALTALRQTGNGLILLGTLHLKGVTQHLRSAKKD